MPPNAPVEQYWSITAYDRQTHALINNMPRASRSSQIPEMQKNPDGSVDIYFGPKAPAGKDIELGADRSGPQVRTHVPRLRAEERILREDWILPDVEKVS